MTYDLNEARRLHDRHPECPLMCASKCTQPNGMAYRWPCPTATALGATGRSEWTDDPDGTVITITPPPCGKQTMHYTLSPCVLPADHHEDHTDQNGDTW